MVDASVAVTAALARDGFAELGEDLIAPSLAWSEARSVLHELLWRGEISPEDAEAARASLEGAPIERRDPKRLGREAWRVADELGMAKTYDAEYVALALIAGCRLVTLDRRLRRVADRLGCVVLPAEL